MWCLKWEHTMLVEKIRWPILNQMLKWTKWLSFTTNLLIYHSMQSCKVEIVICLMLLALEIWHDTRNISLIYFWWYLCSKGKNDLDLHAQVLYIVLLCSHISLLLLTSFVIECHVDMCWPKLNSYIIFYFTPKRYV